MALVDMRDMLYHAYENSYAVGAFDLVSLDFLEAVIEAAEQCRAPVILSIAEPHFAHYDFELMLPAVEAAARRASVPVAVQLDHGRSLDSVIRAIRLGVNGVMIDASDLSLPDNIKATREAVAIAHACGLPVVGEVGYVGGEEGEGAEQHPGETALTVPSEARVFVERTGVDFLAVSIGTVQGRAKQRARLDFPRLKQIRKLVDVPLVIHGGSGLNEDQFRRLTAAGVAKINYFTALSDVAAQTMRARMKQARDGSFTDLKRGVKEAIREEVIRCLRLWGTAGRAAEVLSRCRPQSPVEYLLLFETPGLEAAERRALLLRARQVLDGLPGVRETFAGDIVEAAGRYRHLLRVRFTSEAAAESFPEHPDWKAFRRRYLQSRLGEQLSVNCRSIDAPLPGEPEGELALTLLPAGGESPKY